jgi:protein disulfide-isomerase
MVLLVFAIGVSGNSFGQKPAAGKEKQLVWYTDLQKAQEQSKATNKPIFAFFTGSDWCGWCHKLQNEVFSKTAFVKWAHDKVILLELDFPRNKQLSPELQQQNSSLQQAFHVQGYPTCWLFYLTKDPASNNMNIEALGSLGYPRDPEQGKEEVKFLAEANQILSKKKNS